MQVPIEKGGGADDWPGPRREAGNAQEVVVRLVYLFGLATRRVLSVDRRPTAGKGLFMVSQVACG